MGNLINPDNSGKRRDRMVKATVLAMRELAQRRKVDADTRDLVAFLVLTLKQIDATIDETCRAWEKRDYWIKADNFRQQWVWTQAAATKLEQAILENKWSLIPPTVLDMTRHLSSVTLPKRNNWGTPWNGAYALLIEKHNRAEATMRR